MSSRQLIDRMRAPFSGLFGIRYPRFAELGWANDVMQKARNAAGSSTLDLLGTDALDNRLVGGQYFRAIKTPIRCQISANGKIGTTTPFFTNCNDVTPLEIMRIDCTFGTADGATNTGYVSKEVQGQAPAGATCMTGTFNLNATANTLQVATLAGGRGWPTLVLNPGEQLTFNIASAVTSLASLYVTVWVRPATGASFAQYSRPANGDIATATMYLNLIPGQVVRAIAMRWTAAGTNGGAVTADVTKDTGTTAPGAGTSVLVAAQSVKGAANTAVFPALAVSAATLTMAAGDRLAVKMTGTLTALAGLVVTVFFTSGVDNHILIPISFWDAAATDRTVFVSDDPWVVVDYWETWSTASTSNTGLLTKDTGTTAPGAGTGLLSDNTNTGILTSATANTPVEGTLVTNKPNLWLAKGDRLGLKNAGTTGSLAGVFAAVLLRKP